MDYKTPTVTVLKNKPEVLMKLIEYLFLENLHLISFTTSVYLCNG